MRLRDSILESLRLLAEQEAQRRYASEVPIADVPAELVCGWFDDAYHPESPAFQREFSPSELEALAEFSAHFEEAQRQLGGSLPPLSVLHGQARWQELVRAARATLERMSRNAD